MKSIVRIFLIICISGFMAKGQKIDYKKIILPDNAENVSTEERLVQLAWQNNPRSSIVQNNHEAAVYNVKLARWSWLSYFNVQGNLNEFSIDPSSTERSQFFPRYNFSLGFSLAAFSEIPLNIKANKEQEEIAQQEINLEKLSIRREVLQSYETYKLNQEILELQSLTTEDAYANYVLTEERFKNGEESLEAYNQAQERYNNQKLEELNAEYQFNVAKLQLEELIGVAVEDVLQE